MTPLEISVHKGKVSARAYGKCHPSDCDWGKVDAIVYGPSVGSNLADTAKVLTVSYPVDFADTLMIIRPVEGDRLQAEVLTHFKDRSRRSDYVTTETFARSPTPAEEGPSARLLGRWRSLETSRGGIGSMWEFKKGGVVDYSSGAIVETSYRVEGNELVLPPATIGGLDQRQTMTWIGNDRLSLRSGAQPPIELARKGSGSDTRGKIVGEWGGVRDMGGTEVECLFLFYADDKALLLIRFRPEQGSYSIDNGKIHLDLLGRPSAEGAFKVDGEVLTLTMAERSGRYTRY